MIEVTLMSALRHEFKPAKPAQALPLRPVAGENLGGSVGSFSFEHMMDEPEAKLSEDDVTFSLVRSHLIQVQLAERP